MSTETRQHIIVDAEYHKAIKSLAGVQGCDMTEVVQTILAKDDIFKKKLAEVKKRDSQ